MMAIEQNRRLLLELEKYRNDVNKETINAGIDDLNLDRLKPIVDMVAKSRAAYIGELMSLANEATDKGPNIDRLKARREEFMELVEATNALETAIERGYVDILS